MGTMASQITSLTIVYSIIYSGGHQRKHQSSASLAFVRGIHRWPPNSSHKGPVTRKMFPFEDVIMECHIHIKFMGSIYSAFLKRLWIRSNINKFIEKITALNTSPLSAEQSLVTLCFPDRLKLTDFNQDYEGNSPLRNYHPLYANHRSVSKVFEIRNNHFILVGFIFVIKLFYYGHDANVALRFTTINHNRLK